MSSVLLTFLEKIFYVIFALISNKHKKYNYLYSGFVYLKNSKVAFVMHVYVIEVIKIYIYIIKNYKLAINGSTCFSLPCFSQLSFQAVEMNVPYNVTRFNKYIV